MLQQSCLKIRVDGRVIEARQGENLLELLKANGFRIPTLCYHPGLPSYGSCRLCTVQVQEGRKESLVTSCTYPVREEGMEVFTSPEEVVKLRKMIIKLLLARVPSAEVLGELAEEYGVEPEERMVKGPGKEKASSKKGRPGSEDNIGEEEKEKCILCGLCVRACNEALRKNAISFTFRGINREVAPPLHLPPEECTGCGACSQVCPTGAVYTRVSGDKVEVYPWGAEKSMVRCPECGREHFTGQLVQEVDAVFSSNYPENDLRRYVNLCQKCKRRASANKWTGGSQKF